MKADRSTRTRKGVTLEHTRGRTRPIAGDFFRSFFVEHLRLPTFFLVLGFTIFTKAEERQTQPASGNATYHFECIPLLTRRPPEKLTISTRMRGELRPIRNPFYQHAVWRLWFTDNSPIEISRDGERTTLAVANEAAWNDCYMSLDYGHSDGILKPAANYFTAPMYYHPTLFAPPELLQSFGVNFTAESLPSRGRYIVDDYDNNDKTERDFFFANCVRSSNAYISYNDTDPERAHDEYDGLFAHSFQSIGHSGSMMLAIKKMINAGECIPRATREKLKSNGLYAPALLTLFRAALPFSNADGEPVPYENELRHRPVYSMAGDSMNYADRWFKANIPYHTYDEKLHAQTMIEMAKRMEVPPPVAVIDLTGITVRKGGVTLVERQTQDDRLKSVNKTIIRAWGKAQETLEIEVNLKKSIDLLDRPLSYHAHILYPNQRHVKISPGEDEGAFRVTAEDDPDRPKGRIPILFFVRNGADLPSNPVFLNFYWPSDGETQADYPHHPASYQSLIPANIRINDNRRPVVKYEPENDGSDIIRCAPGAQIAFRVHATDPEGFSTTIYRWPGEIGKLSKDQFSCRIPLEGHQPEYPLHFIVSDGTGGFTGKLVKLVPVKRSEK